MVEVRLGEKIDEDFFFQAEEVPRGLENLEIKIHCK